MAIRNRTKHNDSCREKIKTSQLINRLQNHIFNHEGNQDFSKHDMTPSQVKAAEALLKKTLPDLQATQLSNDPENPITPIISDKPLTKKEWDEQYASDVGTAGGPAEGVN